MFTLVYTSREAWPMSRQDLLLILTQSRKNNITYNITGLLLYHDKSFIQVLEGEPENVEHLYGNIRRDSRNIQVTPILKKTVDERNFPDWTMAFASALEKERENIPGFSNFFEPGFNAASLVKQPDEVLDLLLEFKDNPKLRKLVEL